MSKPLCYKTSNNKYPECPPRMDDGRHFTDYRPSCSVNNLIRYKNNLYKTNDYRQFLINNASNLIDLNREYACQKNCCAPCSKNTEMPVQHNQVCDKEGCKINLNDTKGLGIGRPNGVPDEYFDNITSYPKNLPPNKCE